MRKKLFYGLMVGLGAAAISMVLWLTGALDRWEYITWNWRVRFFSERNPASDKVKLILIDQASLDWGKNENGWPWPWPREVYGPIIDFCRRSGAKSIAFDMLYTEPSVNGVSDDEAFGAAIQRAPAFVSTVVLGKEAGMTTNWPAEIPVPKLSIEGLEAWLKQVNKEQSVAPNALFPIVQVATNATWLSNVMDVPDKDSVYRRSIFFRVFGGHAVPSLGFAAWLAAEKTMPRLSLEKGWLHIGQTRIPIDDQGRAILRFRGRGGLHQSYSAAAVIQSELRLQAGEAPTIKDPNVFKDCYVLLGPSAPALLDLRATPISKVAPGVELHATALDNLLEQIFLRDATLSTVLLLSLALSLISGILVTISRKAWQSVVVSVLCLPIPVVLGYAFYTAGVWWPMVAGETGVLLALIGAVVVNYATEGRQKAFIKSAFKFYLGPDVIDQIIANPSQLQLGGEKRELTIYFSDIEKFSSFSERLESSVLTTLLNDYLSEMGAIIQDEGGYLDKYIGDAIVAFWNAPMAQADHAVRAVRAALRCQKKLTELRPEFQQRTGAQVKTRIGLNTGDVVVGNMGSRERFNYTILGDAANLASRLEGANKAFGTYMMVAESTWSKTGGQFVGRELARLTVVGRKTPVRVFEPIGLSGDSRPAWFPEFERALGLYYAGTFAEALKLFEQWPDDPASRAYVARCRMLITEPPKSWEGVWSLTEK